MQYLRYGVLAAVIAALVALLPGDGRARGHDRLRRGDVCAESAADLSIEPLIMRVCSIEVTGKVVSDGRAVIGARISAGDWWQTISDEAGQFAIPCLHEGGELRVEGHQSVRPVVVAPGANEVQLEVIPGVLVRVEIRRDGRPWPDAKLYVLTGLKGQYAGRGRQTGPSRWEVRLVPGTYRVMAEDRTKALRSESVVTTVSLGEEPREITLELRPK